MVITFPSNTTEIIDKIRGAIGRPVVFHTVPTYSGCSTCTLDVVAQTSTDSYCPDCNGMYWIPIPNTVTVTGHITWKSADDLNWQTGGQLFDGDCRVQIKLKNDTLSMLDITDYIVVDGKVLEEKSRILRGTPTLNRVLINCLERDKEE